MVVFNDFIPDIEVEHALDSAIQHDIDEKLNNSKLEGYSELKAFLKKHKKCIGITITDLKSNTSRRNSYSFYYKEIMIPSI